MKKYEILLKKDFKNYYFNLLIYKTMEKIEKILKIMRDETNLHESVIQRVNVLNNLLLKGNLYKEQEEKARKSSEILMLELKYFRDEVFLPLVLEVKELLDADNLLNIKDKKERLNELLNYLWSTKIMKPFLEINVLETQKVLYIISEIEFLL